MVPHNLLFVLDTPEILDYVVALLRNMLLKQNG